MNLMQNPVVVVRTRGDRVESQHHGALAVVTGDKITTAVGDVATGAFCRSAAKPFQAAAALRAGVDSAFSLGPREIALMTASHSGEASHVEVVASLLERGGFRPDDLRCGIHVPFSRQVAQSLVRSGTPPSILHNNCSGKHAGMLLFAKHLGADPSRYIDPSHPIQTKIRAAVRELCRLEEPWPRVAVDGCSAPTFELPLDALARGYRDVANPELAAPEWRETLAKVKGAMLAHPDLIAGTDRFDTDLMRRGRGRFVSKIGAEGVIGIGVVGAGVGLAVKIEDGDSRASEALALHALERLALLDAGDLEALDAYRARPMKNHAGVAIGRVEVVALP